MFTRLWKAVVVVDTDLKQELLQKFIQMGATGYTTVDCNGAGRRVVFQDPYSSHTQVRVEVVGPRSLCEDIVRLVSGPEYATYPIAAYLEGVEVIQPERFLGPSPASSSPA
jgi:hypothetical protein